MNNQTQENKYFEENGPEERCQLYVAIDNDTGLYNTRAKAFLFGQQPWMKSQNPTVEEVIEQMDYSNSRHSMWTNVLNDAEVWDSYYILEFRKYLPNVQFMKVSLSAV